MPTEPRRSVAWLASLTLLALWVCRCTLPQPPHRVVVLDGAGQRREIPCRVSQHRIESGPYVLATLSQYDELDPRSGLFHGLSGAPVVDEFGEVVGAFSLLLLDRPGPGFGVLPRSQFDRAWRHGRAAANRRAGSDLAANPKLEPGSPVGAAWIWGDVYAGATGRIVDLQSSEALIFAHAVQSSARGPCLYALMSTRQLSLEPEGWTLGQIAEWGSIVGTVRHDGKRGCYATLGDAPPALRVEVEVQRDGLAEHYECGAWVARDPRHVGMWTERAIRSLLSGYDFYASDTEARVCTVIDGVEEESAVSSPPSFPWPATIADAVMARVPAPSETEQIRVSVTLAPWRSTP